MTTTTTIPSITLNVQRLNVRRAIAEALSQDIAEVETYQRDTDCEGFRCQQYQTGGHVFIALPSRRHETLSSTEHLRPWRVVAQVTTANCSQIYVVLQRSELDTLTEVTPGPELRYLLHCSIHGEHSISEAQYLRELQLGDSAWVCYAAPGCPGEVRPVGDDEHEGTLDGQDDLHEDFPGQRISAPGDSPAPAPRRDYAAERANLQRELAQHTQLLDDFAAVKQQQPQESTKRPRSTSTSKQTRTAELLQANYGAEFALLYRSMRDFVVRCEGSAQYMDSAGFAQSMRGQLVAQMHVVEARIRGIEVK